MATTRTPGITVLADGRRFIEKRYLGVRIGLRVGAVTQARAEERLRAEMARVECDVACKAHSRPTFTDCAARYLQQSRGRRSFDVVQWHVAVLQKYIRVSADLMEEPSRVAKPDSPASVKELMEALDRGVLRKRFFARVRRRRSEWLNRRPL